MLRSVLGVSNFGAQTEMRIKTAFSKFVKRGSYLKKLMHLEEVYTNINLAIKLKNGMNEVGADTFINYLYYAIVMANPLNIIPNVKLINGYLLNDNRNDIFGHMLKDLELCVSDLLLHDILKLKKVSDSVLMDRGSELEKKYCMHLFQSPETIYHSVCYKYCQTSIAWYV